MPTIPPLPGGIRPPPIPGNIPLPPKPLGVVLPPPPSTGDSLVYPNPKKLKQEEAPPEGLLAESLFLAKYSVISN